MELEYASNGKANAALATGIIGTAGVGLSLLNGLGGLFGGNNNATNAIASGLASAVPNMLNGENSLVSRYALNQSELLAQKDAEIQSLKTSAEMDTKMLELYKYFEAKDKAQQTAVAEIAAAQAVTNQKLTDQIAYITHDYQTSIATEAAARQCADNTVVNYVNSTFYPQLIAGITTGTTTTAEKTYNPLSPASNS